MKTSIYTLLFTTVCFASIAVADNAAFDKACAVISADLVDKCIDHGTSATRENCDHVYEFVRFVKKFSEDEKAKVQKHLSNIQFRCFSNQDDSVIREQKQEAKTFFTKLLEKHGVVCAFQQKDFVAILNSVWFRSLVKVEFDSSLLVKAV
jgi:hypothetical protein